MLVLFFGCVSLVKVSNCAGLFCLPIADWVKDLVLLRRINTLTWLVLACVIALSAGCTTANVGSPKDYDLQSRLIQELGPPLRAAQQARVLSSQASTGDARAQWELGCRYYCGVGVDVDYKRVAQLWLASADAGFCDAETGLAILYAKGEGVEKSDLRAYMYLLLAQEGDSSYANTASALLNVMTKELEPSIVNEATRLAKERRRRKPGCIGENTNESSPALPLSETNR
jgi:hypothetical protein